MLAKFVDSFYSVLATFASFKPKGRVTTPELSEHLRSLAIRAHNWGCTCTRSTTHTCSDKDHVCSSDSFRQNFFTFFCSLTANFWMTSSTKPRVNLGPSWITVSAFVLLRACNICVGCDEFNTSNTFVNHSVNGVTTTTTDTNYLNTAPCAAAVSNENVIISYPPYSSNMLPIKSTERSVSFGFCLRTLLESSLGATGTSCTVSTELLVLDLVELAGSNVDWNTKGLVLTKEFISLNRFLSKKIPLQ